MDSGAHYDHCLTFGIAAAIYLEEYAKESKLASLLEINISNLAGVPSIIYGLLGLEVFVRIMEMGASVLAGSFTLGFTNSAYCNCFNPGSH